MTGHDDCLAPKFDKEKLDNVRARKDDVEPMITLLFIIARDYRITLCETKEWRNYE